MRKPRSSPLVILTIAFAAFTLGFMLGKGQNHDAIVVNVPARMLTEPAEPTQNQTETPETEKEIRFPIDINRAEKEELMLLPGVGEVLAQRILDFRIRYGPFLSVEELLKVEGFGQKKLLEIWDMITIGG